MHNLAFTFLSTMLLGVSILSGQTDLPQCPEEPFFLSPIDPICADKDTPTFYSFTIVNEGEPGEYEFQVAATNALCGTVTQEFEVTTLTSPAIDIPAPIEGCLDAEIAICDYFELLPAEAQEIQWSVLRGMVQFSNANTRCPSLRFLSNEETILQLSGKDLCNNTFEFILPVWVRQPPAIEIDFEGLGVLCEDGRSFPLLEQYILPNETDSLVSYEIPLEGFREGCLKVTYSDTVEVLPKDTRAAFSLHYESVCSPAVIRLTNSSTPSSNQLIDWGDGSTPEAVESLAEIVHIYDFARDTTVLITLVSAQCSRDTFMKEIEILAAPSAGFEVVALSSFCLGDTLQPYLSPMPSAPMEMASTTPFFPLLNPTRSRLSEVSRWLTEGGDWYFPAMEAVQARIAWELDGMVTIGDAY